MGVDYIILVFITSIGLYQIATIPAGLKGLWFFKWRAVQYAFGIIAIVGAFTWFFLDEDRNYQHTIEGAQQLGLFLGCIIAAYVFTGIVSSVIRANVATRPKEPVKGKQHDLGVETLKKTTLLGGILSSLRHEREK